MRSSYPVGEIGQGWRSCRERQRKPPALRPGGTPRSTRRNVFLTSGVGTSDRSRDLLIALLHSPHLLVFHPARHVEVDMTNGFASLLRHVLNGKPDWQLLENCAPIKPGPFGWWGLRRRHSQSGPASWSSHRALPSRRLCLERDEVLLTLIDGPYLSGFTALPLTTENSRLL